MAQAKLDRRSLEELDRIKKNITNAHQYFKPNYDRFHLFRKFVFKTSISEEERNILIALKKPQIEFNILEAFISRLLGEFSKHEPSIEVTPADGVPVDLATIDLVEGHIRHIIYEANKNSCSYEVYKDLLSGGFSVVKLFTDYATPMSFNQIIKLERAFDPTLCGFDPMARYSHKGDGRYCFELFPQSKEDFERENPDIDIKTVSFSRGISEFNWSYQNGKEDIIIRAEYFEKKTKRTKIVKLANGRVMTAKNYEKFEDFWKEQQYLEQMPVVVGKPRMTDLETICRHRLIESQIMDYKETDYTYLPLVFVDGNSILLRESESNSVQQMTRPYVYHAEGIQKLKNFAGQTLGNELENMIQHKFIIAKESLPQEEEYLDALDNIQYGNTVVYQAYSENNPDKPLPPPREVVRTPIPQEVMATYSVTDQTSQTILGSYDAALGINDNQLSGVAIIEAATQTNAAAMPFVTGYLQAFTHLGNMIADLMPKYIVTPRTIPIIGMDGKREYAPVNGKMGDPGQNGQPPKKGAMIDYDENALNVCITAGVNFQIAKNQALQQILGVMGASEEFAKFMNGPGLPILVKNFTIHGADQLAEMVPAWQAEQAKAKEQEQKMQQQMMEQNPLIMDAKTKAMKVQADAQNNQVKNQIAMGELAIKKQEADSNSIKVQAEASQAQIDASVQREKANAEIFSHSVDAAAKLSESKHKQSIDLERLAHDKQMDHHKSIRESAALHHEMKQPHKESKK